jgi:hypothetical protein
MLSRRSLWTKDTRDFDITEGGLTETFLGMQVEQWRGKICQHLDNYIQEILDEYKVFQATEASQLCSYKRDIETNPSYRN